MDKNRRRFLKQAAVSTLAAGAVIGSQPPAVHSAKKYRWKMVTTWPKNFPGLGTGAQYLAQLIGELSNRRLTVRVYGAGELVPAFQSFDAVSRGTVQMGHGAAYYWKGKNEACQFFTTVPFGLNSQEMAAWLTQGGGQALWDQLYAPFNLKPFAAGSTGVQMGGWFNQEINSLADYKGLIMRMPGLGGEVIRRAGATPMTLPGAEIFQALKTGTIDATEWVGPYNDLAFGLHKAAKFYYWPGWHEPGSIIECIVNQKALASLPQDLQNIVRQAMRIAHQQMANEYTHHNSLALQTLLTQHKVLLRRFPDTVLKAMEKISLDVVQELAAKSPLNQKIYHSYTTFRDQAMAWDQLGETGYSQARALGQTRAI